MISATTMKTQLLMFAVGVACTLLINSNGISAFSTVIRSSSRPSSVGSATATITTTSIGKFCLFCFVLFCFVVFAWLSQTIRLLFVFFIERSTVDLTV
jgi:hypothetical protein